MHAEHLLVVDDESHVLEILCSTLESAGYQVWTTTDGDAALKLLEQQPFDLLLADVKMPRMEGLTLLREVNRRSPDVPVLLMTDHGTLTIAVEAMGQGAHGLLFKPFDPETMLSTVNNALEKRRLQEENVLVSAHLPLLRLNRVLFSETNLDQLAEQALAVVARTLNADLAGLEIWSEASDGRSFAKRLGPFDTRESNLLSSFNAWLYRWAQDSANDLFWYVANPDTFLKAAPVFDLEQLMSSLAMTDLLCTRFKRQDKVFGIMCLGRIDAASPFTRIDAEMMRVLGSQALVILENLFLYEAVIESRQRWETTFDAITDGISILDQEFTILRANQALVQMLDTSAGKLAGQKCYQVFHCEPGHPAACPHRRALEEGITQTVEVDEPQLGTTLLTSAYPLRDTKGEITGLVHVMKDITQRKRAQEQLIQSEKLAALGRLAASLAHEINNPLQALSSGLRLLKRPDLDEKKRQQYLSIAKREVDRLIGIVERMIGFYRPSRDKLLPTDVHTLLDEMLFLAGKKLQHSHITVQREWAGDLPLANAVANQLKQVFLNLIVNAIDAMPDGGTLTISTGRTQDELDIYVRFTDTGHGLSPEEASRIFEPFYTTRPQGTGLGLSISYNIVQQHEGRIEVESQPGRGATFTVFLLVGGGGRG